MTLGAKKVALVAVMTATIEGVKLALTALPNVEAVTLLCAAYGYVFGPLGLLATSLFVVLETFIYPINTWIIYYMIHWNAVCLFFWLLGKREIKNKIILAAIATAIAVAQTAFFGVETTFVDILVFVGFKPNFWKAFSVMYVRGIVFYVVQVVCNLILFPLAFVPFTDVLKKIKKKYFEKPVKSDGTKVSGGDEEKLSESVDNKRSE